MTVHPVGDSTRVPVRGHSALSALAAALLLALVPAAASAQGFGVFEQGTCAMGRGSAVAASSCQDGSSLFFNPAGIAGHRGLTLSAGATGILAVGQFTADRTGDVTTMNRKVVPVPHAYLTYGIDDRFAIGLGFFTPYGLETAWPDRSDAAFLGYDTRLHSFYLEPAAAVRLLDGRVSLGAGLTFVMSKIQLNQLLDLSAQPVPSPSVPPGTTFGQLGIPNHTAFADAHLSSDVATGWGGNFGLQVQVTDAITFGARYLTRVTLDYTGSASFDPVSTGIILPADNPFGVPAGTPLDALLQAAGLFSGPLADQGVRNRITMPDQLVLALGVRPSDRLELEADYYWTNWSTFGRLPIEFQGGAGTEVRVEDFEDTNGIRLGGQLDMDDGITLRLGYIYNPPAAPAKTVTPLLPEANRSQFAGGLGWRMDRHWELNVSYSYLLQEDRRGRVQDPLPGMEPTAALNTGAYQYAGHLFATTVTLHL